VFAIVRAGRAQSTEAMLLCARADSSGSHTLAMLVAFAHYAQRECHAIIICYIDVEQMYWARDIILVAADDGAYGMHAFLNAYTGGSRLVARGGGIVAGVCVDPSPAAMAPFTHADILYTMLDGKLPNLDLVNLVVKLLHKEGITPTLYGYVSRGSLCTCKLVE
jgi:hypothetical protein